jgi:hypothetical protein
MGIRRSAFSLDLFLGGTAAFGRAIRVLMRRRRSPMSDSRPPKGGELFGDLTSTLPDLCTCRWTDQLACCFGVSPAGG